MWEWVQWFAFEADVLRLCAFWSFFAFLGALELVSPVLLQPAERGQRWPTNLGLGLLNMALIPFAPVSAIAATEWAHAAGFGLLNYFAMPLWPAALASLAFCSFAGYGAHVLMHKIPILWKVHRVHHLD